MSDGNPTPSSRPTAIDLVAAAVARVTPRALHPRIDAVRHDVRQMVRSLTVDKTHPYSSPGSTVDAPPPLDEISIVSALLPASLAERYDAIRRDVRSMTRGVRGEKAPVTVDRKPSADTARAENPSQGASTEPARSLQPRKMRVVEVRRETQDASSFVLEDPSGAAFSFAPGQFVTVVSHVKGETHRRAYSISSLTSELPRFAITVKRVDGGLVSNHLNDTVRDGDTMEILGPSGSFTLAAAGPAAPEQLWLFVGGSGITPIFSMLRDALAKHPWTHVTLVYANRAKDTVIFREALDEVSREYGARFRHLPVLERQDPYAEVTGRLDQETCAAVCEVLEVPADAQCFVCGPEPMMDAVRATLLARGVPREHIHEERFTSPQKRTHDAPASRGGHKLEIRYGRNGRKSLVTRPDQTVLEAGLEAGLDMPFSCTMGGCGACKLKLVSGSIDMVEPNCLLESEKAEGAVLACVGCTTSDAVVEVP
ncbi:MAG: ferredoxin--NADP reductase [Myxococcales bacterium]|nr:ferredoxin--NADP reductase [Myxococcales bacterium]